MELRDLYDSNRNLCGKTVVKGETIPEGMRILVVCAIIQNSNNEFMIQKRVESKNGKFGLTSGHPKAGESSKEGMLTELYEELGLIIPPNELVLFHSELHDDETFRDLYFLKANIDVSTLSFQESEVEFAKWATFDEIVSLFNKGIFCHTHYDDLKKYLNYRRHFSN